MKCFRIQILLILFFSGSSLFAQARKENNEEQRAYFVKMLTKIAHPVLQATAEDRLKSVMPVETAPHAYGDRDKVTHLEAFGRTLSGISPWLQLGPDNTPEGKLRAEYINLTV